MLDTPKCIHKLGLGVHTWQRPSSGLIKQVKGVSKDGTEDKCICLSLFWPVSVIASLGEEAGPKAEVTSQSPSLSEGMA